MKFIEQMKITFMSLVAIVTGAMGCQKNLHLVSPTNSPEMSEHKAQGERKFLTLELPNHLKVLLVSDPNVNQSAAAVDVAVGSQFDPPQYQGVAHYLEHMLFLGTQKYPKVGEYSEFLGKNQGSDNAYTSEINTNYFFEVNHDAFREALDRFAQFFVAPTFDPVFAEKEKNAVHNEHSKNIQNDGWREFRMLGLLTKPGHPEAQFGTGNLETLSKVTRKALVEFYEAHYSADKMTLSLVSKYDLKTLEAWVRESFKDVPLRKTEPDHIPSEMFDAKDLPRVVKLIPVKDEKKLMIVFETPYPVPHWQDKSDKILATLLSVETPGSLASRLKNESLANTISVDAEDLGKSGTVMINIDLTEKGFNQSDLVTEYVFGYLKMLRTQKITDLETYFVEQSQLARLRYFHSELKQGSSAASTFALLMQNFPALEVEERSELLYAFNANYLTELLNKYLVPEKATVILESQGLKTTQKEHFYGLEYSVAKPEAKTLARWQTATADYGFPAPNTYIPKKEDLGVLNLENKGEPFQLEKTETAVTYFASSKFKQPKTHLGLRLFVPNSMSSSKNFVLTQLYVESMKESLREFVYPIEQAGTTTEIVLDNDGLLVIMSGYSYQMTDRLSEIVDRLKTLNVSQERFSDIKAKYLREMKNRKFNIAYQLAGYEMNSLSVSPFFHVDELPAVAKDIDLAALKEFAHSTLFDSSAVQLLVYGNEPAGNWKGVSQHILSTQINPSKVLELTAARKAALKWEAKKSFGYNLLAEVNNNNVWWSKIQFGKRGPKTQALAELFSALYSDDYYSQLRTEKQMGYIVNFNQFRTKEATGIQYIVQSEKYTPDQIAKESMAWTTQKIEKISGLEDDYINQLVASISDRLMQPSAEMDEEFTKLQDEVDQLNADFNNNANVVKSLKALSADKTALKKALADGFNRQLGGQVSVYFSAAASAKASMLPETILISEPAKFRNSCERL